MARDLVMKLTVEVSRQGLVSYLVMVKILKECFFYQYSGS